MSKEIRQLERKLMLPIVLGFLMTIGSCASQQHVDILIESGTLYDGTEALPYSADIAICGELICAVEPAGEKRFSAKRIIDASGLIISPGFIDPHTHAYSDLTSTDKNHNQNYLFQGVTTVVTGNDGGGYPDVNNAIQNLNPNGIGTNLAVFVGHGKIRQHVMGNDQREATEQELSQMKALVENAMQQGALGLSSGLYYVPGSFASTAEVIELAKIAAQHNGIYDTHLRDESTFNIGFLNAIEEAIEIADKADIHLHLAHLKALGVDVWRQSAQAIELIEQSQARGISISADQYPWQASGTNIKSAVVPKWALASDNLSFSDRMKNPDYSDRVKMQIAANIRRRGGADALLITASKDQSLVGKTLLQIAEQRQQKPEETVLELLKLGLVRVASFNMLKEDIEAFMVKPWVVTSSDGTNGHPRKFASFPKKYQDYVVEKPLLSLGDFIHRSSLKTANILNIKDRGIIKQGFKADILIFDTEKYAPNADFKSWNKLSSGVIYLLVNGQLAIDQETYTGALAGNFVKPAP